jgi:hypothetical protein
MSRDNLHYFGASKTLSFIFGLAILAAPLDATSIIIDVKTDRILVVADSRAVEQNPSGNQVRDDKCKIIILGKMIAFAETGNEGYTPTGPGDPLREWHGTSEVLKAFDSTPDHDLYKVALAWSIQIANDFQLFYRSNSERVRSLAVQGVLLEGIFAGRNSQGSLAFYIANVALDDTLQAREGAVIPIGYSVAELPLKDEPYSTNAVTRELIDGKTDSAKEVAKLWAKKLRKIPRADRRLRWLEFLVEKTAEFDSQVHGPVNAVEVKPSSVTWLHNETCKDR